MRHRSGKKHYNRTSSHRKAMFINLTQALVKSHTIKTTLVKAKGLRTYIEPLITLCKEDNDARRKLVFSRIRSKETSKKLFEVVAPALKDRPGGYLRILKCGFRAGDNAPMAIIEFVDRNVEAKKVDKKKKDPTKEADKKEEKKVATA